MSRNGKREIYQNINQMFSLCGEDTGSLLFSLLASIFENVYNYQILLLQLDQNMVSLFFFFILIKYSQAHFNLRKRQ